jgi:hypothetical protein
MLAPATVGRLSRIGNEFGEFGNPLHLNATTLLKYNKAPNAILACLYELLSSALGW